MTDSLDTDPDVIRARTRVVEAKRLRRSSSPSYRARREAEHSNAVHALLRAEMKARARIKPLTEEQADAIIKMVLELPPQKPSMSRESGDDTHYPGRTFDDA